MTKYQEEQELPKVGQFEVSIFMKMVFCSLIGIFSFLSHLNGMEKHRF